MLPIRSLSIFSTKVLQRPAVTAAKGFQQLSSAKLATCVVNRSSLCCPQRFRFISSFSTRSSSTFSFFKGSQGSKLSAFKEPNSSYLSSMSATNPSESGDGMIKRRVNNVIKSQEDKREYKCLELSNGLRILLISDPTTDKSAAAMNVNVGHLKDPRDLPGLAHFCEHMLFLGTEKYPSENEYFKFLSNHGGGANAFTASDHTCYYFDVAPDHLEGALDRFAQFFRGPLFTESATEREVNAVDSENKNNLQNDLWRAMQLERSLSRQDHDYSKFGTGNKQTLLDDAKEKGLNTRDELLRFHKQHYSSNQMGFAILGKESLEELESMVLQRFQDVENKNIERYSWDDHPWGPDQLGRKIRLVPIKDLRNLSVVFPIPDLHDHYRSRPSHYISHLLGHEGEGSLLSELKRRGWVNGLCAGARKGAKGFDFFSVDVDLSEDGILHVEDILDLLFQYLAMIRAEGPQKWIHEECRKLDEIRFRFKDKEKPQGYVQNLSTELYEYPLEEILYGHYIMDEYKPELIEMVLDKLKPERMTYTVIAKEFQGKEGNKNEKWYGTEYLDEKIDPALMKRLQDTCLTCQELKLPTQNDFIPDKFDLKPREEHKEAEPEIVRDDTMARVWHKQDNEFMLPKRCLYFAFTSPMIYESPLSQNLAHMYVMLLNDELTEFTYDANLAGLKYSISNSRYGLSVTVSGYDQKQEVLLKKLVEKIVNFKPDPARFLVLRELYERSLKNFAMEQPYQHAIFYTSHILSEKSWSYDEFLTAMEDVTLPALEDFVPRLLANLHIESLIYGNTTKEESLNLVKEVEKILNEKRKVKPLFVSQLNKDREIQLTKGKDLCFDKENSTHENSAVEVYYQTGVQESRQNMLLELLAQLIKEPAFDTLRTKETLGYIVFSSARRACGAQGLRVLVQGEKDPDYVEARIELFLKNMKETIQEMPDEEFRDNVEALAARRLEKPKRLGAKGVQYWGEISGRQFHFTRDEDEVKVLRGVTKEELITFFDQMVLSPGKDRSKMSVRIFSTNAKNRLASGEALETEEFKETSKSLGESRSAQEKIKDVAKFKIEQPLLPRPKPFRDLPPLGLQDPSLKSML